MEHAKVNVSPEVLASLFNLQEVEHVSVKTGLSGVQTIQLKVRDPRIPKGVEMLDVVVHRHSNGTFSFGWRVPGTETVIQSPPLLVTR